MEENEKKMGMVGHYRSFYNIARKLKDPESRLIFYEALDAYRFDGIEPKDLPYEVDLVWEGIRANIDADLRNRRQGAKGGTQKGVSAKAKKGALHSENTPLEEETEPPYTENEKGANCGGTDTGVKNENTSLSEKKYPPILNSDSKEEEEIEEEIEEEDDDSARVTVHAVEDWLESHGLTLSDKDAKKICVSLVTRRLDIDYLDYALKYVSGKSYKSRDGTGNIRFDEIPEGNRKGLYINAVTEWQDMMQGYESWHKDKMQKEKLCPPVQKTPKRPVTCPSCGAQLYESAGESMCIKCNGYLEWGGVAWRIRPFANKTLAEGIPQMRGTDAATA